MYACLKLDTAKREVVSQGESLICQLNDRASGTLVDNKQTSSRCREPSYYSNASYSISG